MEAPPTDQNPQYVRVKRLNETFFILCDEYDLVYKIKGKMAIIASRPVQSMKLYKSNRLLDDDASCHDQQVNNNCELYATYKNLDAEKEQWEDLEEVSGIHFGDPLQQTQTIKVVDDTSGD